MDKRLSDLAKRHEFDVIDLISSYYPNRIGKAMNIYYQIIADMDRKKVAWDSDYVCNEIRRRMGG